MDEGDVAAEFFVAFAGGGVEDEVEDVEAGEEGGGEVDVLHGGDFGVVAAVERVGCGEDGGAGVERGGDAGFGDGDGLLLHDFVDGGSVGVVHLVELVDAADAVVGEDEGAALEDHFVGDGVAHDSGCEPDAGGPTAGGVDSAWGDLADVFEELGFGDTGVTHETDVDVAADLHAVAHFLCGAADEEEEETLFDVVVAVDLRGDGFGEGVVEIALGAELLDAADGARVDGDVVVLLFVLLDVHGLEVGVGEQAGLDGLEAGVGGGQEDAGNVDDLAGVDGAGLGAVGVDGEGAGDVADGDLVGHFLDADLLEGEELGRAGRHEELAAGVVGLALVGGTVDEGRKGLGLDLLEDFGAAAVARVGVDQDGGLDVGDAGGDAADGDEVAEVGAADVADGHGLGAGIGGGRERLEVDLVAAGEEGGEELRGGVEGEGVGAGVRGGDVAVAALGEDDIEDVVVVAGAVSIGCAMLYSLSRCAYHLQYTEWGPTYSPGSLAE